MEQLHITVKLHDALITPLLSQTYQMSWSEGGKKQGVEVFGKMLTPVPILGEPADIHSFASANRPDIITVIIIIISPN